MNEKLLEALCMDLDAITFWHKEDGIIPATATKMEIKDDKEKETVQIPEVSIT